MKNLQIQAEGMETIILFIKTLRY